MAGTRHVRYGPERRLRNVCSCAALGGKAHIGQVSRFVSTLPGKYLSPVSLVDLKFLNELAAGDAVTSNRPL
jgi:hypothetical protein